VKGNDQLIAALNDLLADELTAINQYVVHAEMTGNWGYEKLHEATEARSRDEMRHAETLIERIIYLEGLPIVSDLKKIHIGPEVPAQHQNDLDAEAGAIKAYNEAIALAVKVSDNGTREILESILRDEEEHLDWLEAQLDQIGQMGSQIYLLGQLEED
jgi:bacterioferritin